MTLTDVRGQTTACTDANGWIAYTDDWKGIRTQYTCDAAGRLLDGTTAAGATVIAHLARLSRSCRAARFG